MACVVRRCPEGLPRQMKRHRLRAHCPRCRHQQVFVQAEINHPLHLVLALLTAGLWIISWLALCIGKVYRPWRCEHCAWHKPEFGIDSRPTISLNPRSRSRLSPSEPPTPLLPTPLMGVQPSQLQP
jgi:hypothetical protein